MTLAKRLIGAFTFVLMSYPLCGFNGGFLGCFGSPTLMSVHVQDTEYRDGELVKAQPRPAQQVWGLWNFDNANPVGTVKSFGFNQSVFTGTNGRYDVTDARLNANWGLQVELTLPVTKPIQLLPM